MIQVKVTKNKSIHKVTIKGHANYSEYGSDIVCAAVSSIAVTSIDGILKIDEKSIHYSQKEGFIEITVNNDNKITNLLLENMIDLLKDLEKKYKKYIKIEEVSN